jgi:hypothetical protein
VTGTDWEFKPIFRRNFKAIFQERVGVSLDDCDFSHIKAHLEEKREEKKNWTAE